ncbi:MAG: hypothetical protein NWP69_02030, partial [Congregibacter sp.]|nr:hypothetical protein [Congregibacter sp.]
MTEQYQRVKPTPFDAPAPAPVGAQAGSAANSNARPGWLLPAFGGLTALALVVIFALPRWVD